MPPKQKGSPRKAYWALKNALSSDEKKIIDYYELEWFLRTRVPTTSEVAERTKLSHVEINHALTRRPVTKALDQRGIPWQQHSQAELTEKQIAAAITVMNFVDKRSFEEKLDQLGILPATYYAWLKDPQFKNFVDGLADDNLRNIRPSAVAEFTKKINNGDWGAIKFWLETTGELNHNEMPASEVLIKMLIEIIQEEVKDPETLGRISQRIISATQNRTLDAPSFEVREEPKAITAEALEHDEELAKAQKMLGYS
jgi:hypothetical protein